jgi:hypothetical protein
MNEVKNEGWLKWKMLETPSCNSNGRNDGVGRMFDESSFSALKSETLQ